MGRDSRLHERVQRHRLSDLVFPEHEVLIFLKRWRSNRLALNVLQKKTNDRKTYDAMDVKRKCVYF